MIQSQIVADSIDPKGNRLSTFLVTFPRIILAELNTHRMFSRNSASSRAIPFKKMVESVETNPFIPMAWQKDHKGMQGVEYLDDMMASVAKDEWLHARSNAVRTAKILNTEEFVTKQLCNRLLEPFMYHTVLLTSSKEGLDNFFELRCPQYTFYLANGNSKVFKSKKDALNYFISEEMQHSWEKANKFSNLEWLEYNKGQAEIHMMALAEAMWDSYNESTPKQLKEGEWHIPFEDKIDNLKLDEVYKELCWNGYNHRIPMMVPSLDEMKVEFLDLKIKIAIGMAARTSYTVVGDEKEVSYETLIGIHDKMLDMKPFHASPYEHCAKCMNEEEFTFHYYRGSLTDRNEKKLNNGWCRNYKGFIQYRHLIENQ